MKEVLILGPGCPKCERLHANVQEAVRELALACEVRKVTAVADIMKYGVMITPALVVDGQVKAVGKVPSTADLRELLQ
ncbi:MAG: thioredoxin family protein [Candidatus Krumholzibacteriia bacterium]